jgi:hypothetical protein
MNSDFKDLLCALSDFKVRFLVVGAYAVMHHTEPRFTKDLDLWIEPELGNARRFREALIRFGAWLQHMKVEDFCEERVMFQIGLPPTRVDFLTSIPGLEFEGSWERRVEVVIGSVVFPVLGLDDLIAAKQAAGRNQDLLDLAKLQASRRESLGEGSAGG